MAGRPRSTDPREAVPLRLNRSVIDAIRKRLKPGQSVGAWVEKVVLAQFGGPAPTREAATARRPKPNECSHPIGRRIGHTCGACLKTL